MRYTSAVCALVAAITLATPSWAATQLKMTGSVSDIFARQNNASAATPAGTIHAGDAITLSATFDRSKAELTALYDADPNVNIYYLPGTTVSISIGSYTRSWAPTYSGNASVQLWNDRIVTPGQGGVDSQSFSFFDYNIQPTSVLPFDLGSGQQSALATLNMFDFTGTARTNDLISQLVDPSAFGSKSFTYGLLNADTNLFVGVNGTIGNVTLAELSPVTPLNLFGSTVTATLLYPGMSYYSGGGSAIVGNDVEFQPGFFTRAGDAAPQSIDVGTSSISLFTNAAATYSTSDFNGFRLDFSGYTGSLDDLRIAPSSTFQPTDFTVNGNSVYINVSGKTVTANDVLVLTAIPEPGTWAMLIIGFAATGGALRVRRRAASALA